MLLCSLSCCEKSAACLLTIVNVCSGVRCNGRSVSCVELKCTWEQPYIVAHGLNLLVLEFLFCVKPTFVCVRLFWRHSCSTPSYFFTRCSQPCSVEAGVALSYPEVTEEAEAVSESTDSDDVTSVSSADCESSDVIPALSPQRPSLQNLGPSGCSSLSVPRSDWTCLDGFECSKDKVAGDTWGVVSFRDSGVGSKSWVLLSDCWIKLKLELKGVWKDLDDAAPGASGDFGVLFDLSSVLESEGWLWYVPLQFTEECEEVVTLKQSSVCNELHVSLVVFMWRPDFPFLRLTHPSSSSSSSSSPGLPLSCLGCSPLM